MGNKKKKVLQKNLPSRTLPKLQSLDRKKSQTAILKPERLLWSPRTKPKKTTGAKAEQSILVERGNCGNFFPHLSLYILKVH